VRHLPESAAAEPRAVRPNIEQKMSCRICHSKRKTKFNTGRLNICQWCVSLLVDTPVNPDILIESLSGVIERNLESPSEFQIKPDVERKYFSEYGFFKTQLKRMFNSTGYNSEIDAIVKKEYQLATAVRLIPK